MTKAACTIVSLNYIAYARSLAQSFRQFHPTSAFFVLIVDRPTVSETFADEPFQIVLVEDIGIPNFSSIAFKYGVLELNTNVKPSFLKFLLARGIDELIYFDPDIQLFATLDPAFEALATSSVVLTPHSTQPRTNQLEEEVPLLAAGTFNLGFIAVRRSAQAAAVLDWWERRCLELGFSEPATGLFVDQKWINLAPSQFETVGILKHPGCNVAYWNLHERVLSFDSERWLVNGCHPLIFYHFSGIFLSGDRVSKYTTLYTLENRPDLRPIFAAYRTRLIENSAATRASTPYAFGRFSNGEPIAPLLRSVYASSVSQFPGADPFDASGPVYEWARRHGLLTHSNPPVVDKSGSEDWRADPRVRAVNFLLKAVLRVAGVNRYARLLQYLAYISVPRNQRDLFRADLPVRNESERQLPG